MSKLAIHGGRPVIDSPLPAYHTLGPEETRAVLEVMEGGSLSSYLAVAGEFFEGGAGVRQLEAEWAQYFGVAHAVALNSATSALYAAMGAAGVGPGDEVVVSPYTMAASATCAMIYNAVPVFADVDPETFCISPDTIKAVLTPRTKAIVVVDILGHPAEMEGIMALAREHGLVVVEDAAQAYGASLNGRPAGTMGHIGVFSLNYHKTIQCGEGGVAVTDDPELALRLKLIRNHAEVVAEDTHVANLVDLVGFNFRMTELEAAIARQQLRKVAALAAQRQANAARLTQALNGLEGLIPPVVRPGASHGYYLYALRCDQERLGVSRAAFVAALRAEGLPAVEGYVKPIYLSPIYQERIAYGMTGCPFACPLYQGSVSYAKGLCPVCERLHYQELFFTNAIHAGLGPEQIDLVAEAIRKVHRLRAELA